MCHKWFRDKCSVLMSHKNSGTVLRTVSTAAALGTCGPESRPECCSLCTDVSCCWCVIVCISLDNAVDVAEEDRVSESSILCVILSIMSDNVSEFNPHLTLTAVNLVFLNHVIRDEMMLHCQFFFFLLLFVCWFSVWTTVWGGGVVLCAPVLRW